MVPSPAYISPWYDLQPFIIKRMKCIF